MINATPSTSLPAKTQILSTIEGFGLLSLAATFIAAIQAQIMSSTIGIADPNAYQQAINALYLAGLLLDLMAALVSFLTGRWFQRLTTTEIVHLERLFAQASNPEKERRRESIAVKFFAFSLFSGWQLFAAGLACMVSGILTYAWTQQPLPVAIVTTSALAVAAPSIIGILLIGQDGDRRRGIIDRLSELRGDW